MHIKAKNVVPGKIKQNIYSYILSCRKCGTKISTGEVHESEEIKFASITCPECEKSRQKEIERNQAEKEKVEEEKIEEPKVEEPEKQEDGDEEPKKVSHKHKRKK